MATVLAELAALDAEALIAEARRVRGRSCCKDRRSAGTCAPCMATKTPWKRHTAKGFVKRMLDEYDPGGPRLIDKYRSEP